MSASDASAPQTDGAAGADAPPPSGDGDVAVVLPLSPIPAHGSGTSGESLHGGPAAKLPPGEKGKGPARRERELVRDLRGGSASTRRRSVAGTFWGHLQKGAGYLVPNMLKRNTHVSGDTVIGFTKAGLQDSAFTINTRSYYESFIHARDGVRYTPYAVTLSIACMGLAQLIAKSRDACSDRCDTAFNGAETFLGGVGATVLALLSLRANEREERLRAQVRKGVEQRFFSHVEHLPNDTPEQKELAEGRMYALLGMSAKG